MNRFLILYPLFIIISPIAAIDNDSTLTVTDSVQTAEASYPDTVVQVVTDTLPENADTLLQNLQSPEEDVDESDTSGSDTAVSAMVGPSEEIADTIRQETKHEVPDKEKGSEKNENNLSCISIDGALGIKVNLNSTDPASVYRRFGTRKPNWQKVCKLHPEADKYASLSKGFSYIIWGGLGLMLIGSTQQTLATAQKTKAMQEGKMVSGGETAGFGLMFAGIGIELAALPFAIGFRKKAQHVFNHCQDSVRTENQIVCQEVSRLEVKSSGRPLLYRGERRYETGSLRIYSESRKASILVDGILYGNGNLMIDSIPTGEHEVQVQEIERPLRTEMVYVEKGDTAVVRFESRNGRNGVVLAPGFSFTGGTTYALSQEVRYNLAQQGLQVRDMLFEDSKLSRAINIKIGGQGRKKYFGADLYFWHSSLAGDTAGEPEGEYSTPSTTEEPYVRHLNEYMVGGYLEYFRTVASLNDIVKIEPGVKAGLRFYLHLSKVTEAVYYVDDYHEQYYERRLWFTTYDFGGPALRCRIGKKKVSLNIDYTVSFGRDRYWGIGIPALGINQTLTAGFYFCL